MKDLKKYAFANTTIKVEETKVDEAKVNEQNATQDDIQHVDDAAQQTDNAQVDEARGTDWSDAPKNVDDKKVIGPNGKPIADNSGKIKTQKGAETEDSQGDWKVRFPKPEKVAKGKIGAKNLSNNNRALFESFQAREDFFCQGEAGWAKSALIYKWANVFNLVVITVNLDKCEAIDLGGTPVPVEKKGRVRSKVVPPVWVNFMLDHPEYDYLLFLDELNQAPGDVQNALMPIVNDHIICGIEFENMFVGAAGNLQNENDFLTEFSKPLKARFNIIDWETGTPAEWKSSFEYLHETWDPILGKELVSRFEELAVDCFKAPRDIEKKFFKWLRNTTEAATFDKDDTFDSSDVLRRLGKIVKGDSLQGLKEQSRTAYDNIVRLSEFVAQWLQAGGNEGWEAKKSEGATSRSARGKQTSFGLEPADIDLLERAIKTGIFTNSEEADEKHPRGKKYGVTRENFRNLMDEDVLNAEQFTRFIKMMEDKGVKFKYEKDADLPANLPPIPRD